MILTGAQLGQELSLDEQEEAKWQGEGTVKWWMLTFVSTCAVEQTEV